MFALGFATSVFAQVAVGPNINIVADEQFLEKQLNVDAAANPLNPSHIFAGYVTYQPGPLCGYSFSTNDGKTWKNGLLPLGKCDSAAVAWDTNGHAFFMSSTTVSRFTDPDDGKGTFTYDFQKHLDKNDDNNNDDSDSEDSPSKGVLMFQPAPTPGSLPDAPGTLYACFGSCSISRDGGVTYFRARKLKSIGSGPAAAPGPDGSIYLFWRGSSKKENGYRFATLKPDGTASSPVQAIGPSGFFPYDAPALTNLARSMAYPTVASDGNRKIALFFQAYSDRNGFMASPSTGSSPRIFATTSSDAGKTWIRPSAIDYGPHDNTHQFLPRAAYAGGVWSVIFFDARNDGRPLNRVRSEDDGQNFLYLPAGRDRRFDVRVAQGTFDASGKLTFASSTQVSRYEAGGQPNYPFLPVDANGTKSFMGDTIAHAAKVQFLRNPAGTPLPAWRYTGPDDPVTTLAFWPDFRNVRNLTGDWTKFVPAGPPDKPAPLCVNPESRNVNVLFSEISNGLSATVRGSSRLPASGSKVPPEFSVTVSNLSGRDVFVRLTLADTAAAEDWSFAQTLPSPAAIPNDDNALDLKILNGSSVTKTIYYRWRSPGINATPAASVLVKVDEISGVHGSLIPKGLTTTAAYNVASSLPGLPIAGAAHNLTLAVRPTLISDDQVVWTLTGSGALSTAGRAVTNLANGEQLLEAGWKFQLLTSETQWNTGVNMCTLQRVSTDVVLSQVAITQPNSTSTPNFQVSGYAVSSDPIESSAIESSPISEQITNATFSADFGEPVNITLRARKPAPAKLTADSPEPLQLAATTLTPAFDQIGLAILAQAADPITGQVVATAFDTTPPVITPSVTPPPNVFGWNNTVPVIVRFDVTDPQSPIVSKDGCDPDPLTTDTPATTLKCTAVNGATLPVPNLSSSASVLLKIDTMPPVIAPVTTYVSGTWTNQNVTIDFRCSDNAGGSGVASVSGPTTITTQGADRSVTGTCADIAGNVSSLTFRGINIDKTAPVITAAATLPDGTTYQPGSWTNQAVTVRFTCIDNTSGSGVARVTSPVTISIDGFNQSASGTCADLAGNTAAATFSGVNIDTSGASAIVRGTLTDATGKGIAGANVGWMNGTLRVLGSTDVNGSYAFSIPIRTGSTLQATIGVFANGYAPIQRMISLGPGQTFALDFTATPRPPTEVGVVQGHAINVSTRRGIGGVKISILNAGGRLSAVTAADGSFSIAGVGFNDGLLIQTLTNEPPCYVTLSQRLNVSSPVTNVDFPLTPRLTTDLTCPLGPPPGNMFPIDLPDLPPDRSILWKQADSEGIQVIFAANSWHAGHVEDILKLEHVNSSIEITDGFLVATETGGVWWVRPSTDESLPLSNGWKSVDMRSLAPGADGSRHFYASTSGKLSPGGVIYETNTFSLDPLIDWSPIENDPNHMHSCVDIHRVLVIPEVRRIVIACDQGIWWAVIPPSPSAGKTYSWTAAVPGLDVLPADFNGEFTGLARGTGTFGSTQGLSNEGWIVASKWGGTSDTSIVFRGRWENGQLVFHRSNVDVGSGFTFLSLPAGRTSVASCIGDEHFMYMLAAQEDGLASEMLAIWRSTDGGQNFNLVTLPAKPGTQGDWNNAIGVAPYNCDRIAVGWQEGTFVSYDGGATWTRLVDSGDHLHVDVHAVMFDPSDPKTLYIGSDGGVASAAGLAPNVTPVFNSDYNHRLLNFQIYESGVSFGVNGIAVAGLQDNGLVYNQLAPNGPGFWQKVDGGDGFGAASVTPFSGSNDVFLRHENDSPWQHSIWNGGQFVNPKPDTIPIHDPSSAPDPGGIFPDGFRPIGVARLTKYNLAGQRMYAVAAQQWKVYGLFANDDGTDLHWEQLGIVPAFENIQTLATFDGSDVFIGTNAGRIYRLAPPYSFLDVAVQLPINDVNLLPSRSICRIVEPLPGIALAAVGEGNIAGDFNWCNESASGSGHVLRWFGKQWDPAPGVLPGNMAFVAIDAPDIGSIFAATPKRVYVTHDLGHSWLTASANLPETPHGFELHWVRQPDGAKYLYLSTYGRSLWRASLQ